MSAKYHVHIDDWYIIIVYEYVGRRVEINNFVCLSFIRYCTKHSLNSTNFLNSLLRQELFFLFLKKDKYMFDYIFKTKDDKFIYTIYDFPGLCKLK
jgi:hypothetical protein